MRRIFVIPAALAITFALFSNSLSFAAVVMSVEPSLSFVVGSGIRSGNLLVRTTTNDSIIALTADLSIGTGSSTTPPIFANPPGAFGQPGFVGTGNLGVPSFVRGVANFRSASLSLDFNNPEALPTTDQIVARIDFDITGLAPGVYPISFDSVTYDTLANTFTGSGVNGSFTITAVPEPASLMLLGASLGLGLFRRKRVTAC